MLRLLLALLFFAPSVLLAQPVTVLHNAQIYTVDEARPTAEAMAFSEGRIVMVGSEAEVLAAHLDAKRIDAGGHAVVPGLIDAHGHLMGLGQALRTADLFGARSAEEVVERLQAFAADVPDDAWLLGHGWDQNEWVAPGEPAPFPTAADLDAAFPDRPVWLTRVDVHAAWANSAAMARVPDLAAQPDPEAGRILRDDAGQPTGVFIDAAMDFVRDVMPAPTEEEQENRLAAALAEMNRVGLTGLHDAGISLDDLARFRRAIDEGRFPIRLHGMVDGPGPTLDFVCDEGPVVDHGGRLSLRAIKLFSDGALGSRGAALLEDYSDDPGNTGLLMHPPDRLAEIATRAMECDLQVAIHAIGDRGARVVLDAIEAGLAATDGGPGRHRLEHAQVVAPEDFARFAELGVIASVQPTHATSDMGWAEDRLGPERTRGAYAWRTLTDAGARLALGSDFPVESPNPMFGFHAAVTRQAVSGAPEGGWYPEQRLTRAEALRGFTLDAAYAGFREHEIGSLEVGKRADFVILDADPMTAPEADLPRIRPLATYVDGSLVFERVAR